LIIEELLYLANIAKEVADKVFCEATVGSRDENHSAIVRQLFDRPHFRLRFYPDVEIIEMLGAVKNVIAMLAGFADGLKTGFNTRAAVRNILFLYRTKSEVFFVCLDSSIRFSRNDWFRSFV
jgi:glycerol-3-phosphate dehydrogenase (NAD+)